MGVPAFYRWLSQKYSRIIQDCVEKYNKDGTLPNSAEPNPNEIEFDNLYLDMNGIIHPCCHPENGVEPKTDVEKFIAIMEYTERIFNIVRPRKLLFMAIDGVAPRAKMNQQRSRRFRAAKELKERALEEQKLREEWRATGRNVPDAEEKWDSNVITPGTPFMDSLAKYLRFFIHKKQKEDEGWRNIKVILSDANVPGEGEHKVMEHIRLQRADPNHDPNTHHIIHGLDADLIMLALATHEPYFTILREVVFTKHRPTPEERTLPQDKKPFQFLHINILREYLENEFLTGTNYASIPGGFDLERAIDDFIFLCFFAGNDFLPHLPSLDIREGGIDTLFDIYKMLMPTMTSYITDNGNVNLASVERFLVELGRREDEYFRRKKSREDAQKNREKRRREEKEAAILSQKRMKLSAQMLATKNASDQANKDVARAMKEQMMAVVATTEVVETKEVEEEATNGSQTPADGASQAGENSESVSVQGEEQAEEEEEVDFDKKLKGILHEKNVVDAEDTVRLHESGWKERYYQQKFGVPSEGEEGKELREKLCKSYVEGLVWVMRYYYQGVASWSWFFPFHYAPFASDLCNISHLKITFDKGTPFSPFEQLLAVLPEASSHALPKAFAKYMKAEGSPISDFYPEDFKVDMNGKKMAWMGVALLPFVDEKRLKECAAKARKNITLEERKRDCHGDSLLFVAASHALGPTCLTYAYGERLLQAEKTDKEKWDLVMKKGLTIEEASAAVADQDGENMTRLDTEESGGFGGFIGPHVGAFRLDEEIPPPADANGFLDPIPKNSVLSVVYRFPPERRHVPKLLPGVSLPNRQLTANDLEDAMFRSRGGKRRRMENDDARREAVGVVNRMIFAGVAAAPAANFDDRRGLMLPPGALPPPPLYASPSYVPGGGLSRSRGYPSQPQGRGDGSYYGSYDSYGGRGGYAPSRGYDRNYDSGYGRQSYSRSYGDRYGGGYGGDYGRGPYDRSFRENSYESRTYRRDAPAYDRRSDSYRGAPPSAPLAPAPSAAAAPFSFRDAQRRGSQAGYSPARGDRRDGDRGSTGFSFRGRGR